ncbi:MAG: ABC transporter permease [Planctomycetaceae bacterium]|nr:ABC transporter permease [Planctomycetaceae bacterium]
MRANLVYKYGLYGVCVAFLALFLVWPIALTVLGGFQTQIDGRTAWTLRFVLDVFVDPVMRDGLINSLLIACCVTALSLAVALPLALLSTRFDFRGKTIFSSLLLVPLILPPFVGVIGLRMLLGRYGAVNSLLASMGLGDEADPINWLGGWRFFGVVMMEVLHLYPIVYLNVSAALANLDPSMEQAAANLGASRWTRLRRIVLPLIMPGVFAGATIVFIWSFTELGTPLMFDYTAVAPVQIFWGIQEMATSAQPYALVVVMLAIAVGLYLIGKVTIGRRSYAATTRASVAATTKRLTGGKGLLVLLPFAAITFLAVMPHVGVILASLTEPDTWYQSVLPECLTMAHYIGETGALRDADASGSIRNSLIYSVLAMMVDVALGLTIAYLVVRSRVIGGKLLDAMAMMPLAVPGLVIAFGYVAISFQVGGWFEARGLAVPGWLQVVGENPNPIVFLVIAYAVRRLPYVVRSASAGLEQTPRDLEEAALNLGASRWRTVRRIVMPLIMANLIAGGLLAFSFAMLEVSDSLILAQTSEHYPITKRIYELFDRLGDGPYVASAMGVWGMALLTLTLIGASMMLGKKLGAIFRI